MTFFAQLSVVSFFSIGPDKLIRIRRFSWAGLLAGISEMDPAGGGTRTCSMTISRFATLVLVVMFEIPFRGSPGMFLPLPSQDKRKGHAGFVRKFAVRSDLQCKGSVIPYFSTAAPVENGVMHCKPEFPYKAGHAGGVSPDAPRRNGGIEKDLWIGWVERVCGEDWKCQGGSTARPVQLPAGRHYWGREMPSFLIFSCKVERFIPRRAAAPFGPPPSRSRGGRRGCAPAPRRPASPPRQSALGPA